MRFSVQSNLKEIRTSRNCRGYRRPGKLLSIEETARDLTCLRGEIKTVGKTMKENIDSVRTDLFLRLLIDFPVMKLQHVTNWASLREILKFKSFKGRDHERPEFRDLSFWSADLCPDDIESARQLAYEKVQYVRHAERFQTEIKEQYASSPAFDKSASRYGNFRFSFPLSCLLSLYKAQHCGGQEPQLRILGTDIYKQEIAHYIVVHSPYTAQFNDLPIITSTQNISGPVPFVYSMEETLYWRPESTSTSLKLNISERDCKMRLPDPPSNSRRSEPRRKRCAYDPSKRSTYEPRKKRSYEPRCVWNELVFAFHLPANGQLQLSMSRLLSNVTPCDIRQPFLGRSPMKKYKAKEIIRQLREMFVRKMAESEGHS